MAADEDLLLMQAVLVRIEQKSIVESEDVIRLTDYLMRILDSKRYWFEALKNSRTELDTIHAKFKLERISIIQESLIKIVEVKLKPNPPPILESYEESMELALQELKKLEESYKSYAFKLLIG
jgi:hypothetical protein